MGIWKSHGKNKKSNRPTEAAAVEREGILPGSESEKTQRLATHERSARLAAHERGCPRGGADTGTQGRRVREQGLCSARARVNLWQAGRAPSFLRE
jgi:hypothetical protein